MTTFSVVHTRDDVSTHVEGELRLGPPGLVGAELEHFVYDTRRPRARPALARVDGLLAALDLPGGVRCRPSPAARSS